MPGPQQEAPRHERPIFKNSQSLAAPDWHFLYHQQRQRPAAQASAVADLFQSRGQQTMQHLARQMFAAHVLQPNVYVPLSCWASAPAAAGAKATVRNPSAALYCMGSDRPLSIYPLRRFLCPQVISMHKRFGRIFFNKRAPAATTSSLNNPNSNCSTSQHSSHN